MVPHEYTAVQLASSFPGPAVIVAQLLSPLQVRLQSNESAHAMVPSHVATPSQVIAQLAAVLQPMSPLQENMPPQLTVQRPEPHWTFLHADVPQVTSQSPVVGHVTVP